MKPTTFFLSALLTLGMVLTPLAASAAPAPNKEQEAMLLALKNGRIGLQRTETRLQEAKAAYLDVAVSRAGVSLSLAKMAFDTANLMLIMNNNPVEARSWLDKGEQYLKEAGMSLIPSRGAEVRGMFLDASSIPKTEAGVVALVEKMHDAHFNVLLPEVFRRGYTLYPSRFTERDPEFAAGKDMLKVLVREAHKRGMEVHPWIWTFRVRSPGYGNPVLSKLPALASRTEGKESRFLSPASPHAREFVYGLIEEMIKNYDVDGLMLDYIRYDEEIPEDDVSRTQFALDYQARYGKLPPAVIPPNSPLMVEWQLWREQQVNLAVQEISRMVKAQHPRFPLGVAVFRGEAYSRLQKMQHWRHWSNNRWVDWASPMLYTANTEDLNRWLDWETDKRSRQNLLYPILGVHRFASKDNLVEQLQLLNDQNQPGVMIFALAHFDMKILDELKAGPFREPATLPHRNLVRAARKSLAQTSRYMSRVFSQGDFEAAATARMVHAEINAVAQSLPLHETPYWQNTALVERLKSIKSLTDLAPLPAAVRKELYHRLDYTMALVKYNQFQVEGTRYVPTTVPPIKIHEEQKLQPQD